LLVVDLFSIGFCGYYAGPNVFIIDTLGLGDALMARIPPGYTMNWRVGHFERVIPSGYVEAIYDNDANKIEDDQTKQYVEHLWLITRGKLFSPERWEAIWRMNTGQYGILLDQEQYHFPILQKISAQEVSVPLVDVAWNTPGAILGYSSGIEIQYDEMQYASQLKMSLSQIHNFRLIYYDAQHQMIGSDDLSIPSTSQLREIQVGVPANISESGFQFVHILPTKTDRIREARFSMGHFVVYP